MPKARIHPITIPCKVPGCSQWFSDHGGLTNHIWSKHTTFSEQTPPFPSPPQYRSPDDFGEQWDAPMSDNKHTRLENHRIETHPLLNGMPFRFQCTVYIAYIDPGVHRDAAGSILADGTPPPAPGPPPVDNYSPYQD